VDFLAKRVVVIGGGASGMIAAGRAASLGAKTVIFEKNSRLGIKLLITGKGRCNLTNNTDISGFIANIPGNGRFLYGSLNTFSNKHLIDLFKSLGLKVKVERGNRVFPVSNSAKDVVNALTVFMKRYNVEINLNKPVKDISVNSGKITGVILKDGDLFAADSVIICTGGLSYPTTGSTGDGYKMAARLGHVITPLRPSLVPLETKESWVKNVAGLTLKNSEVTVYRESKIITKEFGEMLFTHFGVSGPIILTISRKIIDIFDRPLKLLIDLKPALSIELLNERVLKDFKKYSNKQFKNSLGDLLPKSIISVIVELTKIDPEKTVNQVTATERNRLCHLLKALPLTLLKPRPISEAIVTAGGVSVNEINPKTMESKIIKGLYFAGEVIDIDGFTGGFNLQAAFSTGFCAGTASVM
jgi:predicted Rossmann fold flavoprotein